MHPSWFYYAMHTMHTMHPSWFYLPASRLIVQIFCTLRKSARPTNRPSLHMWNYLKIWNHLKTLWCRSRFHEDVTELCLAWKELWFRKGGLERVPTWLWDQVGWGTWLGQTRLIQVSFHLVMQLRTEIFLWLLWVSATHRKFLLCFFLSCLFLVWFSRKPCL